MKYLILVAVLTACQSMAPALSNKSNIITIDGQSFEKQVKREGDWYSASIRPTKLPYRGAIANLTAQQRWIKLFAAMMTTIEENCRGLIAQEPRIHGDEANFIKFGKSPDQPKYIAAEFSCK